MTESESEGDWESLLDSGQLEANIKKLTILQRPRPEQNQEGRTRMEVICSEEIEGRTQFKPSEPVIKIMKRPEKGVNKSGGNTVQSNPKTQQKSLKQREQEYAEARQRILGRLVCYTPNIIVFFLKFPEKLPLFGEIFSKNKQIFFRKVPGRKV